MTGSRLVVGLVGPIPPPLGGMATQTRQLAGLLRADGIEVVQLASNGPYRPQWVARVPVLRALCRLFGYFFSTWQLAGRVQVIHLMANSGWSWQLHAAPVLWIASWRGTPVIVNYHGGEARSYLEDSLRWVQPSMRRAAALVVPSTFLEEVFADFGFTASVVPNVIDLELFRSAEKSQQQGQEQAGFTLIITRQLERIYGLDTALRAVAQMGPEIPGLRVVIAGEGPLKAELQAQARALGLDDIVQFSGRLERDEIAQLYRRADVMLNPSTVDNMPVSVLEALASGVAVVSTDVGGIPHLVSHGETALLSPAGDAAAMAAHIVQLHRDADLRQRLVASGREHIVQFTWSRVGQSWLTLYRRHRRLKNH